MSSAVCESRLPSAAFVLDGLGGGGGGTRCGDMASNAAAAAIDQWLAQQEAAIQKEAAEKKDGQVDIWASIQSSKKAAGADAPPAPYVHPLVRRSASSLSQKSLEICTESLGSESGSDGVLSSDDLGDYLPCPVADDEDFSVNSDVGKEETEEAEHAPPPPLPPPLRRKELAVVNYHCSISRRSPPRAFPPPLPSLSRRDGPCLSMRPHRRDGRLVVEAVSVPSQKYLHSRRQDGRLVLTIVETTFQEVYPEREEPAMQHLHQQQQQQADADGDEGEEKDRWSEGVATDDDDDDDDDDDVAVTEEEEMEEEEEEEEGEEEVEVVDRGTLVEVKVSRPPQPQSGGLKVQRSSVVINKFVGAAVEGELAVTPSAPPSLPRSDSTTTTTTTATAVVAAAAAASSSLSTDERYWRYGTGPQSAQRHPSPEKLFFTSKRQMNRQDLLHQVRRCSEHLRPLFIWEPCCIATS